MAFQSSVPNRPIPFSEPPYLLNLPSPYYRASHFSWQQACRAFVAKNLLQHAFEWENVLIANLPAPLPVEWLKRLGVHDVLGVVRVEDWDYFHTAIFADEV
jgi:acyl-CoA dehydrogenase